MGVMGMFQHIAQTGPTNKASFRRMARQIAMQAFKMAAANKTVEHAASSESKLCKNFHVDGCRRRDAS